jgi:hypothetical protein
MAPDTYPRRIWAVSVSSTHRIRDTHPPGRIRAGEAVDDELFVAGPYPYLVCTRYGIRTPLDVSALVRQSMMTLGERGPRGLLR